MHLRSWPIADLICAWFELYPSQLIILVTMPSALSRPWWLAGFTMAKLGTLFYHDPPYWGCENDYGKNIFSRADFEALATQMKAIKGQFILSINDVPEIRELFSWAKIEAVETTYTVGKAKSKKVGELIISS